MNFNLSLNRPLHAGGRLGVFVVFVLLFAFALRFHLLGAQSLWGDEGSSYVQATRSFSAIADNAARDIHPPGYYWTLALWRGLTGDSEFALRSLSAFASVITVALTYAITRRILPRTRSRWMGELSAILAAAFAALNTFSLYYAQEARMYALLALWSAAGVWMLLALIERPTGRRAAALGLINAAGLWTQYAFPLVMIAQGAAFVVMVFIGTDRRERAQHVSIEDGAPLRVLALYIAANLLALLLFALWLPTALHQISGWGQASGGLDAQTALSIIVRWLTFGVTAGGVTMAIPFLLAIAGLIVLGKTLPDRDLRWLAPVLLAVIPVTLFLALGLARESNLKFLLPAQIGAAVWLARGVWVIANGFIGRGLAVASARRRLPSILFVILAVSAAAWMLVNLIDGIAPLYADPTYQRADYRSIARVIDGQAGADDVIVLDAPNQVEVFDYYYHGGADVIPLPIGLNADMTATEQVLRDEILSADRRIFAVFWGDRERDPAQVVEGTLDREAYEIDNQWFGDVRLTRYVSGGALLAACPEAVTFDGLIMLQSCALNGAAFSPGDVIELRFDWQTVSSDQPLDRRYKVFVQLLNADGVLVAQRDSEPVGGSMITTDWPLGAVIRDQHGLAIPSDLPLGTYTLIAGWYDANDGSARLAVGDADYFILATVTVQ